MDLASDESKYFFPQPPPPAQHPIQTPPFYIIKKTGNETFLEQNMLPNLLPEERTKLIYEEFVPYWLKYKDHSWPLIRSLYRAHQGQVYLCFFLQFWTASI